MVLLMSMKLGVQGHRARREISRGRDRSRIDVVVLPRRRWRQGRIWGLVGMISRNTLRIGSYGLLYLDLGLLGLLNGRFHDHPTCHLRV